MRNKRWTTLFLLPSLFLVCGCSSSDNSSSVVSSEESSITSSEESSISSESEESSSSLIPEPVETEAIYYDEECHYHERLDGQEPEKEKHVFDGNKCTVCGYFTNKPNLLSLEYNESFSVYNGEELNQQIQRGRPRLRE